MASINKITDIIAAIKVIYPYYAKDTDIKLLANTWNGLLKPYDDKAVEVAMFKCLQTCKQPPTPADVIEQIQSMTKALDMSDEQLWATYIKALRETSYNMKRFHETFIDSTGISQGDQARNNVEKIWQGLDDKIKRYLGSKGELMRNATAWGEGENAFLTWEKPRFMKQMPIMEKRQEYSAMLESGEYKFLLKGE